MDVLVLFLAFLDDLLGGLHLPFYEPTGLRKPGGWSDMLDASFVDKKSWNGFPTYCGQMSLTISSGRPKSDTVFLIFSVTTSLVVACRSMTIRFFEG